MNSENTPLTRSNTIYTYAIYLLLSMHLAGFVGLQSLLTRAWFEALIPFNLLTTAGLLFYFHLHWNKHFIYFILIASLVGYWIEVLGVKTEMIFGSYQYETTLGFKVLEVPLLIGINWLVLAYTTGIITQSIRLPKLLQAMLAASLMVLMDYWIEPFAIRHQMWSWAYNIVPLQNYLGWWLTAFSLQIIFSYLQFAKQNRLALPLFVTQLIFFLAHNLVYYLE